MKAFVCLGSAVYMTSIFTVDVPAQGAKSAFLQIIIYKIYEFCYFVFALKLASSSSPHKEFPVHIRELFSGWALLLKDLQPFALLPLSFWAFKSCGLVFNLGEKNSFIFSQSDKWKICVFSVDKKFCVVLDLKNAVWMNGCYCS